MTPVDAGRSTATDPAPASVGAGNGDVVVGVDLSPASRAALTWAAEHARATDSRLIALHIASVGAPPLVPRPGSPLVAYPLRAADGKRQQEELQELFASVSPEPDWALDHGEGPVGPVLVGRSRAARLLVVGTREHTGLGRVLDGSISHYCLSHATCPVVAVPAGTRT